MPRYGRSRRYRRSNRQIAPFPVGLKSKALMIGRTRNRITKSLLWGSDKPYYIRRSTRTVGNSTGTTKIQQLTNLVSLDSFYALKFTLDDLPNYTELTALFDNYQITCVVVKLIPVKNQINIATAGTVEIPTIGVSYDYDDSSLPTSMDQLRQYATYREYASNQPITLKIYPKMSVATYNGGVVAGYLRPTPKLQKMFRLDCANPTTEHYGIKIGIPTTAAPTGMVTYDIHATYYLRMSGLI